MAQRGMAGQEEGLSPRGKELKSQEGGTRLCIHIITVALLLFHNHLAKDIPVSMMQPYLIKYSYKINDPGLLEPNNHLNLMINFVFPCPILAIQCFWRNDVGLYWITYLSSLSLYIPFFFFWYKATLQISEMGHFVEFLRMLKQTLKRGDLTPFSLGRLMWCPLQVCRFNKHYFNH